LARFSLRAKLPSARHVVRDPLSNLAGVIENVTVTRKWPLLEAPLHRAQVMQ